MFVSASQPGTKLPAPLCSIVLRFEVIVDPAAGFVNLFLSQGVPQGVSYRAFYHSQENWHDL